MKDVNLASFGANAMNSEASRVGEMSAAPSWSAQPWLGGDTLSALAGLNEQSLILFAEQAEVRDPECTHPLVCELAQLWPKLDADALRRAAACPYLLLDAGFADPSRWLWAHGHQVLERERGPTVPFFTVPRASVVMRKVLTYGWHLAQSRESAARLLLGMAAAALAAARRHLPRAPARGKSRRRHIAAAGAPARATDPRCRCACERRRLMSYAVDPQPIWSAINVGAYHPHLPWRLVPFTGGLQKRI
jgi:hypothetical protein